MKLPLSLIQSYIELPEPLERLSEILTTLGIEVDAIEQALPPFSGIVAAKVLSTSPHPEANKLQIAEVDDGTKQWQVVCGAPNCRKGMITAFAKPGSVLYGPDRKEQAIKTALLRGVESSGMLCSASELNIPGGDEGILELPADTLLGEDLLSKLWDPVFELSLTPNLGHCMSALGIARELSAALQRPLKKRARSENSSSEKSPFQASILAPSLCNRYSACLIEDVNIAPSPFWLQQTLLACGIRPINNAVDITNYILLKTGQPLHAFDASRIANQTLLIQTLETETLFNGLDGVEYRLDPEMLVICDETKPLAIAGVLGGAESSVTETTQSILLEAACFDPITVRKTAKRLGLRTDSSQRFEKGVDPHATLDILQEAAELIANICKGTIRSAPLDIKGNPLDARTIKLRPKRVCSLIGIALSFGEIEAILHRLDCSTKILNDEIQVTVPTYRNDLLEEIDLVEEIARIYGYNNIEKKKPLCTVSDLPHDPLFVFEREIRNRMISMGLQEMIHCDLISPKLASISPEWFYPSCEPIQVLAKKSEEYSILRPSLLPAILETVRLNIDQKNSSLLAFEVGRTYLRQEESFSEVPVLGIVLYGKERPHHWERKPQDIDFYDLKGIVESLMLSLRVPSEFTSSNHVSFHPGRQANLLHEDLLIGSIGEVHPHVLERFDIKKRVLFAELNLAHLMQLKKAHYHMKALPQYPSTERDWTVALPSSLHTKEFFCAIETLKLPLLESAELIDLYVQGEEAKRSATFRFTYRDLAKTISFEEAEAAHAKLIAHVIQALSL